MSDPVEQPSVWVIEERTKRGKWKPQVASYVQVKRGYAMTAMREYLEYCQEIGAHPEVRVVEYRRRETSHAR